MLMLPPVQALVTVWWWGGSPKAIVIFGAIGTLSIFAFWVAFALIALLVMYWAFPAGGYLITRAENASSNKGHPYLVGLVLLACYVAVNFSVLLASRKWIRQWVGSER